MRELTRIILHCSATEEGKPFTAEDIRSWHIARGWKDIGYHYVITLDGKVQLGRPIDQPGAHVKGHNRDTIGVCYVGGVRNGQPADTMTELQEVAFLDLIYSLRTVFGWMRLSGHNEYAAKACPSFDVQKKYKFLNLHHGIDYDLLG